MSPAVPNAQRCYGDATGGISWEGLHIQDAGAFAAFLRGEVKARLHDSTEQDGFEGEVRGLATTGMAADYLERFLAARRRDSQPWEVGEALAECLLCGSSDRQVIWPWHTARDKRTPFASLPGANLVGFCVAGEVVWLLFGEVKTSADKQTPPNVMYGPRGMPWQLGEAASRLDLQHALILWLYSRCRLLGLVELFQKAVRAYLESAGKHLVLVGILLRDTAPDELDVRRRATELISLVRDPMKAELTAYYLPIPIERWPAIIREGST